MLILNNVGLYSLKGGDMKKYEVTVPFPVFVTVKVEAESRDDAIEEAISDAQLTAFAGNGGTDKLVGVYSGSIEIGECPLEDAPFSIDVEELEH